MFLPQVNITWTGLGGSFSEVFWLGKRGEGVVLGVKT